MQQKKQQFGHAGKVIEQLRGSAREEIPAVELHMFPEHPLQLNSTWRALIVPKSQQLFGATVYLCRAQSQNQCVAKLTFDYAPIRLFRAWDWALDPVRSMPH